MPPPLSPGATEDYKGQEGQCAIGHGGAKQQQLQRVTATASWRRARAQQITGVCVLLPLAPSRMSEAAEANVPSDSRVQQRVQCVVATASWRRAQPWHIKGLRVLPPLELSRMVEAAEADVLSDLRTSENIPAMEKRRLQRGTGHDGFFV